MPLANNAARQEIDNPCLKEQNMSYKCLSDNNYDQEACAAYFENYKHCKAFWNNIKTERRIEGLHPHLPPVEMRAKIKEEYFAKFRK